MSLGWITVKYLQVDFSGTGVDPNWMAGAQSLHPQLQYQYQQPTGTC